MQRQYRLQQARREQEAAQLAANEERQRMQMLLDEQDKIKNPVVDAKRSTRESVLPGVSRRENQDAGCRFR